MAVWISALSLAALRRHSRGRGGPSADSLVHFVPGRRMFINWFLTAPQPVVSRPYLQNGQPDLPDLFEIGFTRDVVNDHPGGRRGHTVVGLRICASEAKFQFYGQDDSERSLLIQGGLGSAGISRLEVGADSVTMVRLANGWRSPRT